MSTEQIGGEKMDAEHGQPDPERREMELADLLAAALELPHEEQRAFVEGSCDDRSLVEEALALLAFDAQSDTFLAEPAAQILDLASPVETPEEVEEAPRQIGSYTLLRRLGEGGSVHTGACSLFSFPWERL